MEWFPEMEPDCGRGECDKDHAKDLSKFNAMPVVLVVSVIMLGPFVGVLRESVCRTAEVNSGFGDVAETSLCFLLVHNIHTVSDSLVEISLDHGYQLVCGFKL
jgi:hypothetical protein